MTARAALRLGLTAALVAIGLVTAAPALAADGDISNVETSPEQVRLVFAATDTEGEIDPDSVGVTIDGQVVDATAEPLGEETTPIVRSTMLVIDTSSSMNRNDRLAGAKDAAAAFLAAVPEDVLVGLVTFDSGARVVEPPTTDRATLAAAVEALTARGDTAIFDAVVLASQVLGDDGVSSIVLLTDGDEKGSDATLDDATAAVSQPGIRLDAVAFQSNDARDALVPLADAGGGEVDTSGTAEELVARFQEQGEALSRQLLVTAEMPAEAPTGQFNLTVSGDVDGETVTATVVALLRRTGGGPAPTPAPSVLAAPQPTSLAPAPLLRPELIWVAVAVFFLGLAALLAFAFNAAAPAAKTAMSKQLSVYTIVRGQPRERKRESTAFGKSTVAQSAVDLAGRVAARRGLEERLQRRLDAAALPLKPAEWILIQAGLLLVLPLLAFLISGRNAVLTLLAVVIAAAAPPAFLSVRNTRRRAKFADSLPDVLQLMAGSLSAGYSLPQAVDAVVREGNDPIASEFNRALVEARLGVPIEDALETISERMSSKDWAWVVMAVRVQREVGGNLAELLLTVATTLRDRARIRRQIQTLSAEGRLSAWILGGLPIAFTLYMLVARPSYILLLTKEPLGWLMIAGGVTAMVVGSLWMKKIVDVEV
jgi:tight adherence protein B